MSNEEKQTLENNNEYCKCENVTSVHSDTSLDEWGYWYICDTCNKKTEDGFHYYSEDEFEDDIVD